jgi:hypothetical protein
MQNVILRMFLYLLPDFAFEKSREAAFLAADDASLDLYLPPDMFIQE